MSACWGFEIPEMKGWCVGGPGLSPSLCGLPCPTPGTQLGPCMRPTGSPLPQPHVSGPGTREACPSLGPHKSEGPGALLLGVPE